MRKSVEVPGYKKESIEARGGLPNARDPKTATPDERGRMMAEAKTLAGAINQLKARKSSFEKWQAGTRRNSRKNARIRAEAARGLLKLGLLHPTKEAE